MQIINTANRIMESCTDRYLRRATQRFADCFALTEFDNEDTAMSLSIVMESPSLEERTFELYEIKDMMDRAQESWLSQTMLQVATSAEAPPEVREMLGSLPSLAPMLTGLVGGIALRANSDNTKEIVRDMNDLATRMKLLKVVERDFQLVVPVRIGLECIRGCATHAVLKMVEEYAEKNSRNKGAQKLVTDIHEMLNENYRRNKRRGDEDED